MGELRRRSPAAPSSRPLIPAHIAASVRRPDRLAQVRRSGLLDTAPEEPFDRLACELLDAPDGFVTVVDELRSFWKSCIGVSGGDRQNSVDESFCQYVIATGNAVIIDDARLDPMTMDNPSITSMRVIAWAGFGLRIGAKDASRAAEQARASAVRYQQIAKTLQQSLLPADVPVIDGLEVAAAYRLREDDVSGDFYDAVPAPTGWAIFLGDVSGRGAHAARTSALAQHTLRAGAGRAGSPAIVLTDLDATLRRWYAETDVPGT